MKSSVFLMVLIKIIISFFSNKLLVLFYLQDIINQEINNECIRIYMGKHPKHTLWKIHYQFIIENVNPGDTVLDVGTGVSYSYISELAKKCNKIDCCDNKKEIIQKLKDENKFGNINFYILDITKELPDDFYDVVILSHVLEHLVSPLMVLENLKKITKKIIIRLPRYDDHWMNLVKKDQGMFYYKDLDHKKEYSMDEAVELIKSSGWKIEKCVNDVDIKIVAIQ